MLVSLARGITVVSPDTAPRYPYSNSMFLDGERPILIDMGAGATAYQDLPCGKVNLVLLTHFHFDHLHCRSLFPQAGLMAGWQERSIYTDENEYMRFHGYNLWDQLMPGYKREAYSQVMPLPEDVPARPGFRPLPLQGTFDDLHKFTAGKYTITAVYLPGHTFGHYGFYLEKEGILFSGDIDLVASGPWYSSNSADVEELVNSIRRIQEMDPRIVIPSHRKVQQENIRHQLKVYLQVVLDREAKIMDLLKAPQSLADLSKYGLVFPGSNNLYELFWERMTIRNHLSHLLKRNLIYEIEPGIYSRV